MIINSQINPKNDNAQQVLENIFNNLKMRLEMTHCLIMNLILFSLLAGKLTKQTRDATLYKIFQKRTKRDSLQQFSRYQREYLIVTLFLTRLVTLVGFDSAQN